MSPNIGTLQNPKRRYNNIDGWRGYWVPALAIAGSSDTGTYPDSPCPSTVVLQEITRIRKEVLLPAGIKSRSRFGNSSNIFCAKRWLVVSKRDFEKAAVIVNQWLNDNRSSTSYVHNASQEVYL